MSFNTQDISFPFGGLVQGLTGLRNGDEMSWQPRMALPPPTHMHSGDDMPHPPVPPRYQSLLEQIYLDHRLQVLHLLHETGLVFVPLCLVSHGLFC